MGLSLKLQEATDAWRIRWAYGERHNASWKNLGGKERATPKISSGFIALPTDVLSSGRNCLKDAGI